ncbi:MAG: pentapeptide repeat-containing protein [Bacilli bacterium]|nr:pentapeptide repeat-containing protein [Bacilli bacterium]
MVYNILTVEELRKNLRSKLEHYNFPKPYLLDIDKEIYREIMLNKEDNSFAIPFDLVKKLDLSNFSFDNVNIRFLNFKGSTGVVINPENVYNKDLSYCVLEGAKIEGSMDDAIIYYTNFKGTEGIKINPQKIRGKNLAGAVLTDTTITGPLDGVYIRGTVFTGSSGAIVDLDKIYKHDIKHTELTDAKIISGDLALSDDSDYDKLDFEEQKVKKYINIKRS